MNAPEQISLGTEHLDGGDKTSPEPPHLIARIRAVAIKTVFPFVAQQDIRFYLNGVNIRPLDDGTVMIVATDGHRYVVVRDSNGFAEKEIIVSVSKDALKHANNAEHTFDVMSNGQAMFSGKVAEPLFVQPGNSLIDGDFPRIERVASTIGYKEGIAGAVNTEYIRDALKIGESFKTIRFFTKDDDSPLTFVLGGMAEIECFGGIMKLKESFEALPNWFPKPTAPNTLSEM